MDLGKAAIIIPQVVFPAWILVWHFILILKHPSEGRPRTISAHAEEQPILLLIHRLTHGLPLLFIMPYVFGLLLPQGYYLAAIVLVLAAIFDTLEVITLRENSDLGLDTGSGGLIHKLPAWLMAIGYLLYTVIISVNAQVSPWGYWPTLILFFGVLAAFYANKASLQKHFYVLQMSFFMLVTLTMLIAHISLLAKVY